MIFEIITAILVVSELIAILSVQDLRKENSSYK
jgi:hypothetical protein